MATNVKQQTHYNEFHKREKKKSRTINERKKMAKNFSDLMKHVNLQDQEIPY